MNILLIFFFFNHLTGLFMPYSLETYWVYKKLSLPVLREMIAWHYVKNMPEHHICMEESEKFSDIVLPNC